MILLIDNYDSFTWNLVQRLGELDPRLDPDRDLAVVRNDKITPEEVETFAGGRAPDKIIISPGPCSPKEAGVSSAIIQRPRDVQSSADRTPGVSGSTIVLNKVAQVLDLRALAREAQA